MSENNPDRSRRTMLIAGAVLAVILALGVVVSLIAILDDDAPEAGGPTDPSSSTTPDSEDAVCELSETTSETSTLNQPPADVTWGLVEEVALPSSAEHGPGVREDTGFGYCYSHTPEGALLMAANTFGWGEALRRDPVSVVETSIAEGSGYEAALEAAKAGAAGTTGSRPDVQLQIRGFRVLSYTDESALVDIAFQVSTGPFVHMKLELVWDSADWRLRAYPDGSLPPAEELPDLTGYVPWAGA